MIRKRTSSTRQNILAYIRQFTEDKGYSPTVRDIVRGCSISTTSVVQHHLNKLEKEGYILRDPQIFRSIRLLEKETLNDGIPLLGTIAAGNPIPVPSADTWASIPQETLSLPAEFVSGDNIYALKVKGTSMIDALIDDGDTVLMQPVTEIKDGEMVAVWLKDKQEVTLKKIYREPGKIRLQPANQTMSPIYVDPDNIEIQGRVVGVMRRV